MPTILSLSYSKLKQNTYILLKSRNRNVKIAPWTNILDNTQVKNWNPIQFLNSGERRMLPKKNFVKRKNSTTKPKPTLCESDRNSKFWSDDTRLPLHPKSDHWLTIENILCLEFWWDGLDEIEKVQPHKNCILLMLETQTTSIFHIFAGENVSDNTHHYILRTMIPRAKKSCNCPIPQWSLWNILGRPFGEYLFDKKCYITTNQ